MIPMQQPTLRPPWREPAVAAAIAVILIVQALVIWRSLPRALDHDEGEHLRAAAWVASGKTLYRDFAENHTPFLYMILVPLAPSATDGIDATRRYVVIARVLSAAAGIAAVFCIAAIAFHLTGDAMAIPIVLAALLASSWTWLRGVADVRSEPYTLLLFWAGALLVVRASAASRRAMLAAGAGIGLIAVADLWNPKWPLVSLVVLGLYAIHVRRAAAARLWTWIAASFAIAIALPLSAFVAALRLATPRDLFFFSFTYASAISRWYRGAVAGTAAGGFAFCPPWLLPWCALAAAVIVILQRRHRVVLLLVIASTAEVVFLYPYPHLWPQYLVMWACVVALLYGVAISSIDARPGIRISIAAVIAIAFLAYDWTHIKQPANERQWERMADLQRRIAPGEAAWVRPEELPTAVPAGSYYWYSFADQVPFSIAYARTSAANGFLPPLRDEDLPPCRIARGIDAMHVRLLDSRAVQNLPASRRCMEELARRGSLRPIAGTPIWEVVR
jgi:hypothetical protein